MSNKCDRTGESVVDCRIEDSVIAAAARAVGLGGADLTLTMKVQGV